MPPPQLHWCFSTPGRVKKYGGDIMIIRLYYIDIEGISHTRTDLTA
jgi:hypothetical protein